MAPILIARIPNRYDPCRACTQVLIEAELIAMLYTGPGDWTLRRRTVRRWTLNSVRLRTVQRNFPTRVDGAVELHDTHINAITMDGAELDPCNKCSNKNMMK